MIYRCPKCNYNAVEYSTTSHPCPSCGETKLLFTHLEFIVHGDVKSHEVLIDTLTGQLLGFDPCDALISKKTTL